jgi:hypothetical protein
MNNTISMSADFERRKNLRASVWTAAVGGLVLLVIILIKLSSPVIASPPADDFVEIELPDLPNLGTSEVGSGNDQPQLPGDPGPQETSYTPPVQSNEDAVKDVTNDYEKSDDAPPVVKPKVSNPKATKTNLESNTEKTNNTPVPAPPAPPKPKATLNGTRGGSGSGGNGAETYKPGSGEGTGGTGDQGVPGGSPTGKAKNFGVKVFSIPNQSFQDDFNTNAKVAMIVEVDANGKVKSATYTSKGSSGTATEKMKEIARRRAFELKLGNSDAGQKGTVVFNFVVSGG